jgi:hypothetical protein
MFCVSLESRNWFAVAALALTAASGGGMGVAQAADFYDPPEIRRPPVTQYEEYQERYARPRYAPPIVEQRVDVPAACRVVHKRHIDPYGREVVRQVRVCEEGGPPPPPPPRWAYRAPPTYGYGYGRGYEPDPYDAPRPPRAIGSPYEDDLE